MRIIKQHPAKWDGSTDTSKPKENIHLFRFVAICPGAWGGGDTEADAVKNMTRAYGGKAATEMYMVFESQREDLRAPGGCLTHYPPESGWPENSRPMEGVTETRYQKGCKPNKGAYGTVEWPTVKLKK